MLRPLHTIQFITKKMQAPTKQGEYAFLFGEGQAGNRPKTENPGAGASSTCSGKAGAWGLAYTDQDGSPGLGKSSG